MGRVYTPEQVQRGAVPDATSFEPAARELLACVQEVPDFMGALVLGSTTTGTTTARSDLDMIIHYWAAPDTPTSVVTARYEDHLAAIEAKWKTGVECNMYDTRDLISGDHGIDIFFKENLVTVDATSWCVGKNPIDFTHIRNKDKVEAYRNYKNSKRDKFVKNRRSFDVKTLQRALELPSALGRKTLTLLLDSAEVRDDSLVAAPRAVVLEALVQLDLPPSCLKLINQQTDADRAYNHVLEGALAGTVTVDRYRQRLSELYAPAIETAIDLCEELAHFTLDLSDD